MSVTIKDIARICNVSYATVSRAINNDKEINKNTRDKIIKIAKSLGYSPNAIARGLVMKRTCLLGLVVPDISSPYWSEVAKGVESYANEKDYQVLLCDSDWSEAKEILYRETLIEKRVDGIIIGPSSSLTINIFANLKIPRVFVEINPQIKDCDYVITDNIKGAFNATKYLINLGHKDIAFIVEKEDIITHRERLEGYRNALVKYNIEESKSLIIRSSSNDINGGLNATENFLKNNIKFTAIFASNDMIALGAMEALDNNLIKVPEDVSVMGFDDILFSSLPRISLTSISQPKYEIGRSAAMLLIDRIKSKNIKTKKIKLKPQLIIRKTCSQVKK